MVAHIFTLLLAPFVSKFIIFGGHSESLKNVWKWENDVDFEFFLKFKVSLCLESLTNLDAKGAKRSGKMRATNFCKNIFKKTFFAHERSAVKNSFSSYYVWSKVNSCLCEAVYLLKGNYSEVQNDISKVPHSNAMKKKLTSYRCVI